jgi:hypothetical protein
MVSLRPTLTASASVSALNVNPVLRDKIYPKRVKTL